MPELPTYQEWRRKFMEDFRNDSRFTDGERAAFITILQGFSQSGQDMIKNKEIISKTLQLGEVNFWGKKLPITKTDFETVDFDDDKWAAYAGRVMQAMHGQVGARPDSLKYLGQMALNKTAQLFLVGLRNYILEKETHANT